MNGPFAEQGEKLQVPPRTSPTICAARHTDNQGGYDSILTCLNTVLLPW